MWHRISAACFLSRKYSIDISYQSKIKYTLEASLLNRSEIILIWDEKQQDSFLSEFEMMMRTTGCLPKKSKKKKLNDKCNKAGTILFTTEPRFLEAYHPLWQYEHPNIASDNKQ